MIYMNKGEDLNLPFKITISNVDLEGKLFCYGSPKNPCREGVAEPFQKSAAVTAWFRSSVREEVPNFLDTGLDQGCQCGQ